MLKFVSSLMLSVALPRKVRKRLENTTDLSQLIDTMQEQVGVEVSLRRYLLYFIMPLWMGAGLLDWYYHRRTKIEKTAGTHESAIHALMMSEAGLPIMLGLFLEVNSLLLAIMIAAFFIHEATAYWDVAYAEGRREVTPNEQHTHSFLEVLPFMAVSFMICLHWGQFQALVGKGKETARFEFRSKKDPLPRRAVRIILGLVILTVVIPYAEEFWRCYREDKTLTAHPATRHPGE